jgi:toxin ParE1/3/4
MPSKPSLRLRLTSKPPSTWYEREEPGLGFQFLAELRAAYELIVDHPVGYQDIRSGIRRALTRRFPYAVYFSVEGETIECSPSADE